MIGPDPEDGQLNWQLAHEIRATRNVLGAVLQANLQGKFFGENEMQSTVDDLAKLYRSADDKKDQHRLRTMVAILVEALEANRKIQP